MALDADTTVAPNAIERLLAVMEDQSVSAACGFVVPRNVNSVWERGRYVEYLLAHGGWNTRTMAEDMDLTWSMYQEGRKVRFVPEAVCYPIEPHDFHFMSKQLRRWSHGFMQNVQLHWRGLLPVGFLRSVIAWSTLLLLTLLPFEELRQDTDALADRS